MAEQMKDGIRKVLLKRESKRRGKNVYAYKVPYRDANGKQTSETFTTLKAAQGFRDRVRDMRHNGIVIDAKAGQMSVTAYAQTWLSTVRAVKRPETYRQYESHMRLHVLPALGGKQLRNVTRADVQAFVDGLSATLAPRTVRAIHDIVRQLFRRAAVLDKRIPASPCVGIELPEITHTRVHVLTPDEVMALAAEVPGRYRAAVLIAAGAGLRVSEVAGLTWDRIDLEAGTVTVDRQMSTRRTLAPPKTKRSRRIVPIPQMVRDALLAHRAAFPPQHTPLAATGADQPATALLLFTRDGAAMTGTMLGQIFTRARKAVGLPAAVTFHTLRHTYASLLIAAGTNVKAVQERMGHGSIKITMDTYGHLYPTEDLRTRDAIDNAFTSNDDRNHPRRPSSTTAEAA